MIGVAALALAVVPPAARPVPVVKGRWTDAAVAAARDDCGKRLAGLDIVMAPVVPIGSAESCGAPAAIAVARIAGVRIIPAAVLTCPMAAALGHWVTGRLQPLAASMLGTQVVAIANASSYVCRSRNHIAGGKISEHARANALDMASFNYAPVNGRAVPAGWAHWLGADSKPLAGSFIDRVRNGACSDFTTVLGPGADAYHRDHIHLDMLVRKNGYRICQ